MNTEEEAVQTPKESNDSEEEEDRVVYNDEDDDTTEDDNDIDVSSDYDSSEENLDNSALSEEDALRATERLRQKRTIKELLQKEPRLQEGDTWYLLSSHWSKRWKEAVSFQRDDEQIDLNKPSPGQIDNTVLLVAGTTITKRNLIEDYDFIIVSPEIWNAFVDW